MPERVLPRVTGGFLAVLLFWGTGTAAITPEASRLTGHWQGAILVRAAELEYDLALDIAEHHCQGLQVLLSLPEQKVRQHAVTELQAEGGNISFVYDDGKDRSSFSARLSADGQTLAGTLSEAGKSFPFVLERRPPAEPPAVRGLSPGGDELRELFTRDDGRPRLIVILSPTCPGCRNCARLVRRYVFERIQDPELRAYVVWEPIHPTDDRAAAEDSAALLADPRVTHFWGNHRFTGSAFQKAVGMSTPAWDVVLAFGGNRRWRGGQAPVPDLFQHNLAKNPELPQDRLLHGDKLGEEVRGLLQHSPHAP